MSNSIYNMQAFNSWGLFGVYSIDPAPEAGMLSVATDTRSILLESGFDESGLWTIFVGYEPSSPDRSITIYDQEGTITQSHNRTMWYADRIQMRIRGLTYAETYAKMLSIQKYLMLKDPFIEQGAAYKGFVIFGTPYYLGLDEFKRVTWSINFSVLREEYTDG